MQGRPIKVLLVEDNAAHAKLVMRSFREHAVANEIVHVDNGESALEYMFQIGQYQHVETPPDLVLLDLRLPKYDGLHVLSEIKKNPSTANIPVVVLTTSDAEADVNQAYGHHVNSYLVKPIDFIEFSKMLSDLGFYWLVWNEPPKRR